MRRRLIVVAAAISLMVTVAFLAPLIVLVRTVARDRAISDAERDAAEMTTALAVSSDEGLITIAATRTDAGRDHRLTVVLPSGREIGPSAPRDQDLALAEGGTSFSASHPDGTAVFTVINSTGGRNVVRVWVPNALLEKGVSKATFTLVGLGALLVLGALFVSDRLGASMVRPVRRLATAAARLGEGDLAQRVEPDGPKEVAAVGQAFNVLADRVGVLLTVERELVADLSHSLRTPLTVLRFEADAITDPAMRDRVRSAVVELEDAVTALITEARRPIRSDVGAPADLAAVAGDRVVFWSALADDQGRALTADLDRGPLLVRASERDLEAALDAVLGNVFEHTPDGTEFRISLARDAAQGATLVIEDAGPGLDPQRVRRGRSGGGSTGLGLDIARRAAEAAGGALTIERSGLGGARIALVFPLAPA
jgi:signal transduction histidine kinase